MADWIIITLTVCALTSVGGLFVVLYCRYRQWEKEQITRAQEWRKRSEELIQELKAELSQELHSGKK